MYPALLSRPRGKLRQDGVLDSEEMRQVSRAGCMKMLRAISKETKDEVQAEVASIKVKALEDEVLRAMPMTSADW